MLHRRALALVVVAIAVVAGVFATTGSARQQKTFTIGWVPPTVAPFESAMRAGIKKQADALVSAGNTRAVVSTCFLVLGRVKGVSRPAIATVLPTEGGGCVLLDVGATSDCKPQNLAQFAVMGSIYARMLLDREPRIGLLNIGEESSKGNELSVETYKLLQKGPFQFVGNVEGRDILRGVADVVVCDGFTGNILLKFSESILAWRTNMVRGIAARDPRAELGDEVLTSLFGKLKRQLDYAEYGGAPLLGLDGVCIIGHGSSSARAIKNAIRVAVRLVRHGLAERIHTEIAAMEGATW